MAKGTYRWRICALLFFATTINYVDRQVLGVLAPYLQSIIGWNEIQYGYIVTSFQAAYAIGLLVAGGVIDRLGTRIGYAISIAIWSLAAMSHALVQTVMGFAIARFALGLGEAGNFPAAIKTVAEWFPSKERTLQPASSIRDRTWGRLSRRWRCHGSRCGSAGIGLSCSLDS